jgi:hypothetical protein
MITADNSIQNSGIKFFFFEMLIMEVNLIVLTENNSVSKSSIGK